LENQTLVTSAGGAEDRGGKLHLIGLFSEGGVHSTVEHMYALLQMAERYGIEPILHIITDGRDTPPESALGYALKLEEYLSQHPGIVASVSGRYYTMDRDKRWAAHRDGLPRHRAARRASRRSRRAGAYRAVA
jgi:2,3-bisphosphoglycerate-independent phosphoglycerate mutase